MLPTYYGTREQLSHKEAYALKKYLKRHSLLTYENFLLDPALFTWVNLDCHHCRQVHPTTCCEDGQPYSMSIEAEELLATHAKDIIQYYHEPSRMKQLEQVGFLEITERTNGISTIRKCDGNCFFYVADDASGYCSIHRYAEQQQLDHGKIKPYSCTLFPLDIIEMEGSLLLTALTEDTMSFSRWGKEYSEYLCVNFALRKTKGLPEDHFPLAGYKPAWHWSRELLLQTFGEALLTAIEKMEDPSHLTYEERLQP
ncbi:MAG TPA: DUF3109 family protein [Bacillota bacterium]|nr:DUF3109 family protein [Bacillota bacterium]